MTDAPSQSHDMNVPECEGAQYDRVGLAETIKELAGGKHWHPEACAFNSTINPERWYVGCNRYARFATEIATAGERDAELVAALLRNLPDIIYALEKVDRATEDLESARLQADTLKCEAKTSIDMREIAENLGFTSTLEALEALGDAGEHIEVLRNVLVDCLEFIELYSSRWDGRSSRHPNDIAAQARDALTYGD